VGVEQVGVEVVHRHVDPSVDLAGAVLVITPIVILFLALPRYFTQSIATAGVK
jgi:multiple sugar transport system permease protein